MRETIFRGKCKSDGQWVYGNLLETKMSGVYIIGSRLNAVQKGKRLELGDKLWHHEVDPETVGQFTGRKVLGGKEVYEGDILAGADPNGNPFMPAGVYWDALATAYTIQLWFDLEGEVFDLTTLGWAINEMGITFEVIGNVHDNPELLEDNTNA